ncbi:GNAT family N-acetyltransferase [Streptomyces sp. DG2A-72]|uniref:GNAT family N-acetyltransferase n=1 Tax=Streptomyces sp. DG2A-72 TaxID=3051386 RepID=UPI00265B90E2|nr:GNAT family N-acetyltransferase [Streptomyces sp. DG2A-72]MDO0931719.1 GNAT family N-acetyltransferase [Streptomyces sp. DG2A-72]
MPFLIDLVLTRDTLSGTPPQPAIATGDGLVLRPWTATDAPAAHAIFQGPILQQWHAKAADSAEEVGGWIEGRHKDWGEERTAQWAVVDADFDRLLGRVALREIRLDEGTAEVAYRTVIEARGQSIIARATTTLARWALDDIGFHRLELIHAVRNEASRRVATKMGFALEGTKRSAVLHADGGHDMHLHARVKGD